MKNRNLASIDIGTNTFRLLIAEMHFDAVRRNYSFTEIYSDRIITRLGEGIYENRLLTQSSIDRSVAALTKFRESMKRYKVEKSRAIATSALREADNSNAFLNRANEDTGIQINIVSGKEEARIAASGMLIDIRIADTALLTDIGGGSTELIYIKTATDEQHMTEVERRPIEVSSINLGVVYLAGKYMKSDPPDRNDLAAMDSEVSNRISSFVAPFKQLPLAGTSFIGSAGTVTTLAAIAKGLTVFDHGKIHNSTLTLEKIINIYSEISVISSGNRKKYIPFEPARLDIIVPGTLILLKLMETFDFDAVNVSNYGLREGILIELFNE
jgi:exopolyphosphatase/guanosine-5'-triphosphate,3'-diphosphate pyrophosphatase